MAGLEHLDAASLARRAEYLSRRRAPKIEALPKVDIVDGRAAFRDAEHKTAFVNALTRTALELKEYSSAQSYGARMEKVLLDAFGGAKVKAEDGRGDGTLEQVGDTEVKVSLSDKGEWSFQQVRAWQKTHYLLMFFNIEDFFLDLALVPSSVMAEVVNDIGAASHGTKTLNEGKSSAEIEMGLRFQYRDLDAPSANRDKHQSNLLKLLQYSVL